MPTRNPNENREQRTSAFLFFWQAEGSFRALAIPKIQLVFAISLQELRERHRLW
jgi:hypothetical protein